jgi:hypothetical protein
MGDIHRRNFLGEAAGLATAVASFAVPAAAADAGPSPAFSNRAHFFAPPRVKDSLIRCFRDVLGAGLPALLNAPGLAEPIVAFRFPGGGSVSIEFTEDAPDEQRARRGAWLEIWSSDPAALKRRILDAGLAQVSYPATNTFYFAAPGGQIFGVVSARNPSAGELRTGK